MSRSAVTLADAAADGLADTAAGEGLTEVCGDADTAADGVGSTTPDDGLAAATAEALLPLATEGDATAGANVGLGAAVGAAD